MTIVSLTQDRPNRTPWLIILAIVAIAASVSCGSGTQGKNSAAISAGAVEPSSETKPPEEGGEDFASDVVGREPCSDEELLAAQALLTMSLRAALPINATLNVTPIVPHCALAVDSSAEVSADVRAAVLGEVRVAIVWLEGEPALL